MKKTLALLLALTMILALCACGQQAAAPAAAPAAEPAAAPAAAEPAAAPAAEPAADSDLAYVKANGKLVVGITDFEPMDYQDADGNWIGFDADLATAFAESLGVKVEFAEINWDNKVLELNGKSIDCICNGMTITPEVASATSCSNPYMRNAQVVVLPAAEAGKYASVEDMKDLTFAVEAGSAGEGAVAELGFKATPVTAQADALLEVKAGTSDACVIDLLMAVAMVGEGTSYADLTYTFSLNEEQYGVAFRQGSDLTEALNAFLAEQFKAGALDKLADTYGLTGSVIAQ